MALLAKVIGGAVLLSLIFQNCGDFLTESQSPEPSQEKNRLNAAAALSEIVISAHEATRSENFLLDSDSLFSEVDDIQTTSVFRFHVNQSGEYLILGEVLAPSLDENSFYVGIDSTPTEDRIWHIPPSENYGFTPLTQGGPPEGGKTPSPYFFQEGEHAVVLGAREPTRLRSIMIVPMEALDAEEEPHFLGKSLGKSLSEGPDESPAWNVVVRPPELVDPISITVSQTSFLQVATEQMGCGGQYHHIKVPPGQDALITMDEGTDHLKYPLWVTGGRHVHISGIEVRPEIQTGCDVGQAFNFRDSSGKEDNPNLNPRIPGNMVFRLEQSGVTFLEGIDIDLKGIEADCFVIRNHYSGEELTSIKDGQPSEKPVALDLAQRKFHIVNSRCVGVEGLDAGHAPHVGDGVHGDFLQNPVENLGSFIAENITFRHNSSGINIQGWGGVPLDEFILRNYSHAPDPEYIDDVREYHRGQNYNQNMGLIFDVSTRSALFSNVYIGGTLKNSSFGRLKIHGVDMERKSIGPAGQEGIDLNSPNMFMGVFDFAPEDQTGQGYQSPY